MKPTFLIWLTTQTDRDDLIGDLARDTALDTTAHDVSNNLDSWTAHLHCQGACSPALRTLSAAWAEYRSAVQ